MDIGIEEIVNVMIESTTDYLVVFLPLFSVIGGLLLAFLVSNYLIDIIATRRNKEVNNDNE